MQGEMFRLTLFLVMGLVWGTDGAPSCEGGWCLKGGQCIPLERWCDSVVDCADASDEADCPSFVSEKSADASAMSVCSEEELTSNPPRDVPCLIGLSYSGNHCIYGSFVCDQTQDCMDNSDETNCLKEATTTRQTKTTTRQTNTTIVARGEQGVDNCRVAYCSQVCSNVSKICDGFRDCPNGNDEVNCGCLSHQYQCSNGPCIHNAWLCDGTKDCPEGEDEGAQCSSCSGNDFKCFKNQQCVKKSKLCDGRTDCLDGSDEVDCISYENATPSVTFKGISGYSICTDGLILASLQLLCSYSGFSKFEKIEERPIGLFERTISLNSKNEDISNFMKIFQIKRCQSRLKIQMTCVSKVCGKRNPSFETKDSYIINGQRSKLGQWPWQAGIRIREEKGMSGCGGSILNNRWILTAAHCIVDKNDKQINENDIKVAAGTIKLDDTVTWMPIDRIETFNYKPSYLNDIALLRLTDSLTFNDTVQPICLEESSEDMFEDKLPEYEVCVASGYGQIRFKEVTEDYLVHTKMILQTQAKCFFNQKYTFEDSYYNTLIHLCADIYPTTKRAGVCFGDSGGPFVCRDNTGRWTQVGLTSYSHDNIDGVNKCENNIFTRVSTYHDEILKIIRDNP